MIFRLYGVAPKSDLQDDVENTLRVIEARANATRRRLDTLEAQQAALEAQRRKERDVLAASEEGREPT